MKLNLLVLRCADLDAARRFYECVDSVFARHAHDSGPEHYAHDEYGFVLELYPTRSNDGADTSGLGFAVDDLARTAAACAKRGSPLERFNSSRGERASSSGTQMGGASRFKP